MHVILVLIYPYWNVNKIKKVNTIPYPRFNLSILECKLEDEYLACVFTKVLIYPYWNVNREWVQAILAGNAGFNLSILECKCVQGHQVRTGYRVLIYPYWNVN